MTLFAFIVTSVRFLLKLLTAKCLHLMNSLYNGVLLIWCPTVHLLGGSPVHERGVAHTCRNVPERDMSFPSQADNPGRRQGSHDLQQVSRHCYVRVIARVIIGSDGWVLSICFLPSTYATNAENSAIYSTCSHIFSLALNQIKFSWHYCKYMLNSSHFLKYLFFVCWLHSLFQLRKRRLRKFTIVFELIIIKLTRNLLWPSILRWITSLLYIPTYAY